MQHKTNIYVNGVCFYVYFVSQTTKYIAGFERRINGDKTIQNILFMFKN